MSGFRLAAHFVSQRRSVIAEPDGYGWRIRTDEGDIAVRNVEQARRVARQYIGELLRRVGRRGGWGLRVEVGSIAASYGDPDPEAVPMPGAAADPNALVARIRSRWQDGDSAPAALSNALEIVRAYLGGRGRLAA